MITKLKLALLAVPFLLLISCSGSSDTKKIASEVQEPQVAWDATNYIMYNEFLQCSAGPDYSQDALDEMVQAWRNLKLPESMLGAWGYSSLNDENEIVIDQWEISWISMEGAEKGWTEWLSNKNASIWSDKYASVLQCDNSTKKGFDFVFPNNPYTFGPSPENGSFLASFTSCTLNAGMSNEDLSNEIIKYNNWLNSIESKAVEGFYAYGIYFPKFVSVDEDFRYGNFFETLQTITDIDNAWVQSSEETSKLNQQVGSCSNPSLTNAQVFYDPADPDFS
jgi:hypothetical protein